MISIQKNQTIPEHPDLRVLSSSGDYGDNDLIECSTLDNPDFALCAFSSSYIKYGNVVNQFNDPLELGKKLVEIDPDCTHDTAILFKEEEARRIKREGGDFTPENPVPTDENLNTESNEVVEEVNTDEEVVSNDESPVEESTSESTTTTTNETEEVPVTVDNNVTQDSTTTPEVITPEETAPTPEPQPEQVATEPAQPEPPTPVEVIVESVQTILE